MNASSKTRVIVFDDNKDRRESLELLISIKEDMECIGTFENVKHVLSDIQESQPDVVLMDIDMPEINGIEAVRQIRTKYPKLFIIMQTVFEDEEKITSAISAGADGYILKKTSPDKLIEGIREVLEGGAPMTPSVAKLVLRLFHSTHVHQGRAESTLSEREKEVLSLLVKGNSYKMIADQCGISPFTVNAHIRKIYEKLQVHSVAEAVNKALTQRLV
jgi:DNA-binding NarL/FixJ family response regulator